MRSIEPLPSHQLRYGALHAYIFLSQWNIAGATQGEHRWRTPQGLQMYSTNNWSGVRIYTVGHSTRALDELVVLLRVFDVSVLADIRTMPRSRHNPQFNGDALSSAFRSGHLRYVHLAELGM